MRRSKKKTMLGLLLCAILLIGVATVIFFANTLSEIEAINIAKNGTETTADVYEVDNINDSATQMYLKFTFINASSEKIYGETNAVYTADELEAKGFITVDRSENTYYFDTISGNTIQVMYIGDKAVAKDYKIEIWPSIMAGVLLVIGVACFISFIVVLVKIKKEGNQENQNNQVRFS